jgi:hypothetical protein
MFAVRPETGNSGGEELRNASLMESLCLVPRRTLLLANGWAEGRGVEDGAKRGVARNCWDLAVRDATGVMSCDCAEGFFERRKRRGSGVFKPRVR